jgi:hypothetical protein
MCKKVMYCVVSVALVLSVSLRASAGVWSYFDNDSGDQKWGTASNWKTMDWSAGQIADTVPSYSSPQSDVYLGFIGYPNVTVIIDGTQPVAQFQWLTIGFNTSGRLDIVSGGQLNIPGGIVTVGGHGSGTSDAYGVINVDGAGSLAIAENWTIGGHGGTGIINVTNGGMLSLGWWGVTIGNTGTGTINITNGTVKYYGGGLTVGSNGKIVMHPNAKFDLFGDQTALANNLVAQQKIVTTSSRCGLSVVFDEDLNWTYVTVTNCSCTTFDMCDFNHDCYVDFADFASFAGSWLDCTDPTDANCL